MYLDPCSNEKCLSFNSELFKHRFKDGNIHVKVLCLSCGYARFVASAYYREDLPEYSKLVFRKRRKGIRGTNESVRKDET